MRPFLIASVIATAIAGQAVAATPQATVTPTQTTASSMPVLFSISFDQPVKGLQTSGLTPIGGTVTYVASQSADAQGYAQSWLIQITPGGEGNISLVLNAGAAVNAAGEGNAQATASNTCLYDIAPVPTLTVASNDSLVTKTVVFRVTGMPTTVGGYTEKFSLVNPSLVTATNALSVTRTADPGDANAWLITVSPLGYGTVGLSCEAGAFSDKAGNPSPARSLQTNPPYGPASVGSESKISSLAFISETGRSYATGETIDLTATFTKPVTVTGSPTIQLNAQGSAPAPAQATYISGSGTTALRFRYTVAEGNLSSGLDVSGTDGYRAGTGSGLVGDDGYLALTTLPAPGGAGSLALSGAVGVNFTPPKPTVQQARSGDDTPRCGLGSGLGLSLGAVLLAMRRRRSC